MTHNAGTENIPVDPPPFMPVASSVHCRLTVADAGPGAGAADADADRDDEDFSVVEATVVHNIAVLGNIQRHVTASIHMKNSGPI